MNITNARATFGLNAKATPTNGAASGTVQVGLNNETLNLSDATKIISFEALVVGSGSDLVIDVSDLDNTGSTAWTAGTAQVETATAAGTITASGNASVVVTAAGMTGSPKTISVAVLNTDTAATWAGKVRTALAADAGVSSMFTVGGTTTAIVLTRKPVASYTIKGSTVNLYADNDGTLNISLDNGTCTGITTAATSANTTAGVLTVGAYAPELDGNDVFGDATGGMANVYGVYVRNDATHDSITLTQGTVIADYVLTPGAIMMIADTAGELSDADITVEPSTYAKVTITVAGD